MQRRAGTVSSEDAVRHEEGNNQAADPESELGGPEVVLNIVARVLEGVCAHEDQGEQQEEQDVAKAVHIPVSSIICTISV